VWDNIFESGCGEGSAMLKELGGPYVLSKEVIASEFTQSVSRDEHVTIQ
jgi:hypothetical protein